ncbi:MAG: acyl-protein synthetase [Oscillospiraceae bacterium]|nr:acyl-protein synthetase [Oscillospiraceae bacterium]
MTARKKLFRHKNPYDLQGTEPLFIEAMRDNCIFQYENCPEYKKILDGCGFSPYNIRTMEDIQAIPPLPTLFFKRHRLTAIPESHMLIKATSSGTGGRQSFVGFDNAGMLCGLDMVLTMGKTHGLFSKMPANYIILGYKPHKGNNTAVTKTAFGSTFFAPALKRVYALKYENDGYKADIEGVAKALVKFEKQPFPVRFMGFPSYTYFMLKLLAERGIRLRLPKGSRLFLGGGWKQFYTEAVEKTVIYEMAEEYLGIPETAITEFFGAAEHPILYTDCDNHHFHIPIYSRVFIRDPADLSILPTGSVGMVNLVTPMTLGMPLLSVMTDDLGIIHEADECGCGISSPYLEIIGRTGVKGIKTCAAGAEDILNDTGKR